MKYCHVQPVSYRLTVFSFCVVLARRPLDGAGGLVKPDSSLFYSRVRLLSSNVRSGRKLTCSVFSRVILFCVCACFALFYLCWWCDSLSQTVPVSVASVSVDCIRESHPASANWPLDFRPWRWWRCRVIAALVLCEQFYYFCEPFCVWKTRGVGRTTLVFRRDVRHSFSRRIFFCVQTQVTYRSISS